ncbi:MAG: type II toxin-antitoxin system VapC family toxin [Armatimonadetes bacterium]|nr:type II toxin-antitoxin system VapC family toxin [Armatimonadota bacterium]PJB65576.1 MAG: hypothetical protein CO095_13915 [Armatimonadetes bacterium CG_4_9_14_3_um_filter_58_7]
MNGIERILNTNVVVDFLDGDETVVAFWRDRVQGRKAAVSQITRMELLSAPGLTPDAETEIRRLLQGLRVIGIGAAVEEKAVRLRREYRLKLPDAIIAATAEVLDWPLVTADEELARRLSPRVNVLNPRIRTADVNGSLPEGVEGGRLP